MSGAFSGTRDDYSRVRVLSTRVSDTSYACFAPDYLQLVWKLPNPV